jgi:hypothetical protein
MTEIHLSCEDTEGTVLWEDTVPSHVTFAVGEVVHLVSTAIVMVGSCTFDSPVDTPHWPS